MLDRHLSAVQAAFLRPIAARLSSCGVAADTLTVTGFLFGAGSAVLIGTGFEKTALIPFFVNRLLDGLDGAVARLTGPTDRGAFLDIALDFAFYAMVPLAFAIANPADERDGGLPAAGVLHGHRKQFSRIRRHCRQARRLVDRFSAKRHLLSGWTDRRHRNGYRIHRDVSLARPIPGHRHGVCGAGAPDDLDALVLGLARVFGAEAVNLGRLGFICAAGLLLANDTHAADQSIAVGQFSKASLAGWERKAFKGETDYTLVYNSAKKAKLGPMLADASRDVMLNHPHCAKFCVLGGAACNTK